MKKYGPKGLIIFQANIDGPTQGSKPTKAQLEGWVKIYKAAGVSVIDPARRTSKYNYDGSGKSYLPANIIIDAKTRKVLARGVKASGVEAALQQYLP